MSGIGSSWWHGPLRAAQHSYDQVVSDKRSIPGWLIAEMAAIAEAKRAETIAQWGAVYTSAELNQARNLRGRKLEREADLWMKGIHPAQSAAAENQRDLLMLLLLVCSTP